MTPESFRRRFPIFERERKVFLNSCSKGALSDAVESAYGDYLRSWRSEGSPWDVWVDLLERTRSRVASFLGCDADELAVTFCASTAAASVLSAIELGAERNRIVVEDFEFPTMAHNWMAQTRRGAEIVRVRAPEPGERLPVEAFEAALDERVRLVPVAHVCFKNGYRQDVARVAEAARSVGAYSLVDDYQSTGTRPIDVEAMGCDFLVTGTLKYLLGSSGLAFLYVRRERLETLEPLVTGWFGQERPFDFDIERQTYHASARRFETGTPPVPNLYAGLAGMSLVEEVGLEAVESHVTSLATRLIEEAASRGFRVLTPPDPRERGPLVVLACRDSSAIVEASAREGIVVSARGAGLRVSFHYYNLAADVEALVDVLTRHAQHMERS